jgi:hypothetical protein
MRSPHAGARTLCVFSSSPPGGVWLVCNKHSAPFTVVTRAERNAEDPYRHRSGGRPVGKRLIAGLARPGRNTTGLSCERRHSLVGLRRIADRWRPPRPREGRRSHRYRPRRSHFRCADFSDREPCQNLRGTCSHGARGSSSREDHLAPRDIRLAPREALGRAAR